MTTAHSKSFAIEFVLLAVLARLWGSSYLLIKVALTSFPPITLMAVRVTLAACFLLGSLWLRGEHLPTDKSTSRKLFVQSLLNSSVAWRVSHGVRNMLRAGSLACSVRRSRSSYFRSLHHCRRGTHQPATKKTVRLHGSS